RRTCGSSGRPRPWTAPARNERGRFIPARDRTASPALRRLLASRCRAGTLARDWQWRMEDGGLLGGPPHATASRRRYSTRARALSTRAARRRLEPVLLHLVDEGSPREPEPPRGVRLVVVRFGEGLDDRVALDRVDVLAQP